LIDFTRTEQPSVTTYVRTGMCDGNVRVRQYDKRTRIWGI